MHLKSVSVIGLGYIGLPTAAVLAARKMKVVGVDTNASVVDTINQGKIHIIEPDLDMVTRAAVKEGYLRATTKPEPADAFIIAVPTPFKDDHQPDLSYIKAACLSFAPVLAQGNLIILESTSPVGATEQVVEWLAAARPDLSFPTTHGEASDIRVAYCPERVLPGQVLRELVENDRVIGGLTPKCSELAAQLYGVFLDGDCILTTARTAEMCKLTENSYRDLNIAFANELSVICDKLSINVWELIRLANRHPRVNILQPGPGVGGHCIAVDPWFVVAQNPQEARLIRTARTVNDDKPQWVLGKVESALRNLKSRTVACFGLSFKANIDDLRESPALAIALQVARKNWGDVLLVEPNIHALPRAFQGMANVRLVDPRTAIESADILLILVDHREFLALRDRFASHPCVIDTRGILST
jgi:UDP-N-acetyl-D-mannosaminuronic acid dehydrogenase